MTQINNSGVEFYSCEACGLSGSMSPNPKEDGLTYLWDDNRDVTWTEDGDPECPECKGLMKRWNRIFQAE
jgi:hypothetical protein